MSPSRENSFASIQRNTIPAKATNSRYLVRVNSLATLGVALLVSSVAGATPQQTRLELSEWKLITGESGPVNYYTVLKTPEGSVLRASYHPPWKTAVLGYSPKTDARGLKVQWRWRALKLPTGGNECEEGKADSAAMFYVAWREGLKWYALKFVWSATVPKGTRCAHKSSVFKSEETVVLESGPGALNTWVQEEIDLDAEYRKAFAKNNPRAGVPPLKGFAVFTDGDQTHSVSQAEYADFILSNT